MTEECVCEVCGKKYKGRRGLNIHSVLIHGFKQNVNLKEYPLNETNDHTIGLTYVESLNIDNMVFLYEDVLWGIHNKDFTQYKNLGSRDKKKLRYSGLIKGGLYNFPVLTPMAIMKLYTLQLNQIFEKLKIVVLD